MIISHKHKFIFIAIPKTGTTSIEEALKAKIKLKTENYKISKHDICPPERRDRKIRKHSWAREIKEALGKRKYSSYFKFCFVRNPWERMVSIYYEALKTSAHCRPFFDSGERDPWYIHQVKARELAFKDYLFYFKDEWTDYFSIISDSDQTLLVDYIGRTENIADNFNIACNFIGLKDITLPRLNQSNKKSYVGFYDEESKKLVADIYRKDIEYFNYKFGS